MTGEVENKGAALTRFVQIYSVFKNSQGKIVDIDFTFVDGSTCQTSLGTTTDTCVGVGAKEPFEINTTLEQNEFYTIEYYFDWNESENGGNVNNSPTVTLSASPSDGSTPLKVEFVAKASDPDGDPLTYSWDFGDGETAQG